MSATRPHLILIGGFLGAGKTAALLALGRWLADQGIRAAFITNDQGTDLVDTRVLRFCGVATEEIAGGCFCCRFDELVGATRRLRGVLPPDVVVAVAENASPGTEVTLKLCVAAGAPVACPLKLKLVVETCTAGDAARTSRTRSSGASAMKRLPAESRATETGPFNTALVAGPPS